MTEPIDSIPDDLTACQEQLRAALERLRDLERQLDEFVVTTEELQRSYDCLKEELLALKRLLFGPRRERLPEAPGQLHLFDADVPPSLPEFPADPEPDAASSPRRRCNGETDPGRECPLPDGRRTDRQACNESAAPHPRRDPVSRRAPLPPVLPDRSLRLCRPEAMRRRDLGRADGHQPRAVNVPGITAPGSASLICDLGGLCPEPPGGRSDRSGRAGGESPRPRIVDRRAGGQGRASTPTGFTARKIVGGELAGRTSDFDGSRAGLTSVMIARGGRPFAVPLDG